ncbi:MAG TPA: TonB-dependent receptor [Bacteroidia bacterium]|nr:TonB-dependent receptor [Bacteroidia bacterium]
MKNPKLKRLALSVVFCMTGMLLHAQLHTLKGKVTDKTTGLPVPYTSVYLPDLTRGTTADINGDFTLAGLPGNFQRITLSSLGYEAYATTVFFTDSVTSFTFTLDPGNNEMEEVVVVGTQSNAKNQSATTVTTLNQHAMRSRGALSISDAVAKLPGVTQLTTGAGISKPVIRGLYGNRIQTVVMGMRFDNQQWQDEHGLGIQDIGVDRVEVIKGPAALMYGSEAMGGVINIIEEKPADVDSLRGDASLRLFSNTFGTGLDAGVKKSTASHWWRVRLGYESQADYSDGHNKRILNSRFDGYVAKATYGFTRRNWVCANNYLFSKSDFGFIMDTANALVSDARVSRDFSMPHHTVYINLFTTQNTWFGNNGNIFRIIGGAHVNRRMEQEGGNQISLDMQLITVALHAQYEKHFSDSLSLVTGIQSQYQDNKNFGVRIIVPDANLAEGSYYAYLKRVGKIAAIEAGLRFDTRYIRTFSTGGLDTGFYGIPLINKLYTAVNGSVGSCFRVSEEFHIRANITSGYRTPNLAELSSNGVHEGTLRYEIGNANMKIEQNVCGDLGLTFEKKDFEFTASAYYNRFLNYIYLTPTDGDWYGFRIYRFVQTNATLRGGETSVDWSPSFAEWLDVSAAYMMIRATTDEGNYLPFIPADRIDGSVKFELGDHGKWNDVYLRLGTQYCFPQDHPAQFETATSDYMLFDAGAGTVLKLKGGNSFTMDIVGNNLLNKVYYDHLSRFKDFGIYNIGRNISLNLRYEW